MKKTYAEPVISLLNGRIASIKSIANTPKVKQRNTTQNSYSYKHLKRNRGQCVYQSQASYTTQTHKHKTYLNYKYVYVYWMFAVWYNIPFDLSHYARTNQRNSRHAFLRFLCVSLSLSVRNGSNRFIVCCKCKEFWIKLEYVKTGGGFVYRNRRRCNCLIHCILVHVVV